MSRRTQKNVGVIGLGIIGSRVADNLRRRGFHVFVWNRTPRPVPNFVGSHAEVADLCELIQIFVSDDDALIETIEQIKPSLKPHHVVMAHSTVAPHTMRAAAEIVQRRRAQLIDAPFTGSKIAAEKGELVYYVGGEAAALERARPVLAASSKKIIEIGEVGEATTIKVATNMITATTVQAAAEALALVHSAGLSPAKFAAAMEGNGSQSGTLAMKLPNMIEGNFEPHFSTKHMWKDVQIASRLARSHGLNFGATEAARDSLRGEMEEGRGDYDYSSMVRAFFPDGIGKTAATEDEGQQNLSGLHGADLSEPSSNGASKAHADVVEPLATEEVAPTVPTRAEQASEPSEAAETSVERPEAVADEVGASQEPSNASDAAEQTEDEKKEELVVASAEVTAIEEADSSDLKPADKSPGQPEKMSATDDTRISPEPVPAKDPLPAIPNPESRDAKRNFLSRMFGRGLDY